MYHFHGGWVSSSEEVNKGSVTCLVKWEKETGDERKVKIRSLTRVEEERGRRWGRMSGGRWRRRRLTGGGKEARWPQGAGRTLSGLLNAGGRRVPTRGPRVTLTVAHPVQWSPTGQQVCPVQRQLVLGGQPRPRCDLHRPGEDLPPPLPPACTATSSALQTKVIVWFVLSAWQVCPRVGVTAGVWPIAAWWSEEHDGYMHGCGRQWRTLVGEDKTNSWSSQKILFTFLRFCLSFHCLLFVVQCIYVHVCVFPFSAMHCSKVCVHRHFK